MVYLWVLMCNFIYECTQNKKILTCVYFGLIFGWSLNEETLKTVNEMFLITGSNV